MRFLKKINSGGYKIVDKQLEKDRQKLSVFKAKEAQQKLEESKEDGVDTDQLFQRAYQNFEKNYMAAKEGSIEEKIEKLY